MLDSRYVIYFRQVRGAGAKDSEFRLPNAHVWFCLAPFGHCLICLDVNILAILINRSMFEIIQRQQTEPTRVHHIWDVAAGDALTKFGLSHGNPAFSHKYSLTVGQGEDFSTPVPRAGRRAGQG